MKRTLQAKLRKSIRCAEHNFRGLHCAIERRERDCGSLPEALRQFVVDPRENRDHRRFIASLVSKARETKGIWLQFTEFAAETSDSLTKLDFLSICSSQRRLDNRELVVVRQLIGSGGFEDQITALDAIAFKTCREVRRTLIAIMNDPVVALGVRERATENLALQMCAETVEACSRVLSDPNVTMRFWAAYALGQCSGLKPGFRYAATQTLQKALTDHEVAPGWWSVAREAQALTASTREEVEQLQTEIRQILRDPNASAEDRRWAECYTDQIIRVAPTDTAALP